MKYITATILTLFALSVHAQGSYETVYVPDDKRLVLVKKNAPNSCVTHKRWHFMTPEFDVVTPQDIPEECRRDKLVISPSTEPAYCAEYYEEE